MTLVGVRAVGLILGILLVPACASLPPGRVALRATLDTAASECRVTFPVIIRYEIDPFDRLVYYYYENVRYQDREQFLDCVRDRVRDAGVTLRPTPTPPTPTGVGGGTSAPTLVYPGDLRVVTPSTFVAKERAAFSGHWIGSWNEQRAAPHALVVEDVEAAEAVVVFGGMGRGGPTWGRHRAKFLDDRGLRFTGTDGLVVTCQVQPDGTLFATMEHRGQIFRSRMTRRP